MPQTKRRGACIRVGLLFALAVASACSPSTPDGGQAPAAPLEEVVRAIQSADTLRLEGVVNRELRIDEITEFHEKVHTDFVMLLDRSGRFLIAWQETHMDGEQHAWAVWNAGEGPFIYQGDGNYWSSMQDDESALFRGAAGLGNTSFAIMQTFLSTDPAHTPLFPLPLSKFEDEGTHDLEGTPCRKFVYTHEDGAEMILWIDEIQPVIRASHADARDITLAVPPDMQDSFTQQELDDLPQAISFEIREQFTRVALDEDIPASAFQFNLPDDATERTGDPETLGWEGFQSIPFEGTKYDR